MLTGGVKTFACTFVSPDSLNIATSIDNSNFFSYGLKNIDNVIPNALINDCYSFALSGKNKYIMLAFGPEVVDLIDTMRGTNYNKDFLENSTCSLTNNPLTKISSQEDRKNVFNNKWKYIKKCVEVTVLEMGPHPLVYPLDQEGCSITPISELSAKFSGGYCFFKPSGDSQYKIDISISKECLTLNEYGHSKIDLQDLNAELSAYTSSNYKSDLEDLSPLGTTALRFSVNPDKSVLKPSDDFGILRPTFPANYQINDLHLGKILFSKLSSDDIFINIPFIVDNATCLKKNVNGVSSSPCDYSTPFASTISLKDNLGQEVLTWQDGGVAPANWQGVLSGVGFRMTKELIPKNKRYTLVIEFSDPQFLFNSFKNRISKKLGSIDTNFAIWSRAGRINEINDIKILNEIDKMIEVEPIGPLNFNSSLVGVANSRRRLSSYFSTSMFPPIYEKTCNSKGKCIDASETFATFEVSFFLKEDYSISNLHIFRKSDLLGSYSKDINQQPEYICQ